MLRFASRLSSIRHLFSSSKNIQDILRQVKNPQGINIVDAGIVVSEFTNSKN